MNVRTLLVATALLASLAGCAPIAATPPAATPVASSETPEPTDTSANPSEPDGPQPATILITTALLTVIDHEGTTIDHFDYFDDPTAAIAAFSEYFDGAPTVTALDGDNHAWPANRYSWDGFSILDHVGGPGIPYGEDFAVLTTSSSVRGLAIETLSGLTIGSTAASATAAGATPVSIESGGATHAWMELNPLSVDNEFPEAKVFTHLTLSGVGGSITQIVVPGVNYGP